MGTGGTSSGATGTAGSTRDKINEVASSLVKVASNSMEGVRAIFSEVKADGEKIVVSAPGVANKEIPNKSVSSILSEGVKWSDIFKISMGILASMVTGNPIPLMFAQRHAANLNERIKAKENEIKDKIKNINKQIRENKKAAVLSQRTVLKERAKEIRRINAMARLNRNESDYRQLMALRSRLGTKQKEGAVAIKRAEKNGVAKVNTIDKGIIKNVKDSFVRLGYKSADAKKAAETALSKTNSRDIQTVLKLALKEAEGLQRSK
jgi:hypothetical protein